MNKATAKALEQSIKHWERMHSIDPNDATQDFPIASDCSLCALYIDVDCAGCPVAIKTKKIGCRAGPCGKASDSFWNRRHKNGRLSTWVEHSKSMIDFLISLRGQP